MSQKFEGDTSQLSTRQMNFIYNVLSDKGFADGKVTIKPVGEAGDNFVANVIRIIAEKDEKMFKIVAKVAPKIEQVRMAMHTPLLFLNEYVMYTDILPKYTELEKNTGIPEDERLKYAACYGCLLDEYDEIVLLEDLAVSDFIMLNKLKTLTDAEIRLVLKNIARLHSLSYALHHQTPKLYNTLKNKLVDIWSLWDNSETAEQMNQYFQMVEDELIIVCETKYKDSMQGLASRLLDMSSDLRNFDENSKFSVIQQGDLWTNNILFKFQEDTVVSCCMIDYQLSRVNSPVADLTYMILNCTDHVTRKEHFLDWIDYYHKELEDHLQVYGLKVNNIYPRKQLDADLKRHGKLSLGVSMLLVSAISREAAAATEFKAAMENFDQNNMSDIMNGISIQKLNDNTKTIIKSRIEGVIDTCVQFGLI